MKKLIFLVGCVVSIMGTCFALEQTFTDLPASVVVTPLFTISLDKAQIDFGPVGPGSRKVVGEEAYFNQIRCRSNYGHTWYLKAQLLAPPKISGGEATLPLSAFKFKVASGKTLTPAKAAKDFAAFSEQSDLLYMSQGEENNGQEVVLNLQYAFDAPLDALAGTYSGQILLTMVDTP